MRIIAKNSEGAYKGTTMPFVKSDISYQKKYQVSYFNKILNKQVNKDPYFLFSGKISTPVTYALFKEFLKLITEEQIFLEIEENKFYEIYFTSKFDESGAMRFANSKEKLNINFKGVSNYSSVNSYDISVFTWNDLNLWNDPTLWQD